MLLSLLATGDAISADPDRFGFPRLLLGLINAPVIRALSGQE